MHLDRTPRQEQVRGDAGVGAAVRDEPCDRQLSGREGLPAGRDPAARAASAVHAVAAQTRVGTQQFPRGVQVRVQDGRLSVRGTRAPMVTAEREDHGRVFQRLGQLQGPVPARCPSTADASAGVSDSSSPRQRCATATWNPAYGRRAPSVQAAAAASAAAESPVSRARRMSVGNQESGGAGPRPRPTGAARPPPAVRPARPATHVPTTHAPHRTARCQSAPCRTFPCWSVTC